MARYPTRFQLRTLWNAATGVSILVLGLLLFGLIWLCGKVFGFLQPVLVPLAVAGIIAYLLDPVVRLFQKRGLTRGRAVITVFGAATAAALGLTAIMIPLVGNQINEFRSRQAAKVDNGGDYEKPPFDEALVEVLIMERNTQPWTKPLIDPALSAPEELILQRSKLEETAGREPQSPMLRGDALTEALDAAYQKATTDAEGRALPEKDPKELKAEVLASSPRIQLSDTELWQTLKGFQDEAIEWARGGTTKILGFLGLVLGFFMVPIYLYYFLRESAAIKEHWHEYVPLKASRLKTELIGTLTEVNQYLISFFRGQVLVAFIDGILVGIALTVYQLPLGLLIGILMALLGIIPYIGNIITLIPACVLAYFHFSVPENTHFLAPGPWAGVIGVVAIFVIVQQINSLVTAPKIVGDSVGLHPMTVIFSMLFWSLVLGGFVGALLAVPLTAAVKVLFRRYVWERKLKDGPTDPGDGSETWTPEDAAEA